MAIEYRITIEEEDGFERFRKGIRTTWREVVQVQVELDREYLLDSLGDALAHAESRFGTSSNEAHFFRTLRSSFSN